MAALAEGLAEAHETLVTGVGCDTLAGSGFGLEARTLVAPAFSAPLPGSASAPWLTQSRTRFAAAPLPHCVRSPRSRSRLETRRHCDRLDCVAPTATPERETEDAGGFRAHRTAPADGLYLLRLTEPEIARIVANVSWASFSPP